MRAVCLTNDLAAITNSHRMCRCGSRKKANDKNRTTTTKRMKCKWVTNHSYLKENSYGTDGTRRNLPNMKQKSPIIRLRNSQRLGGMFVDSAGTQTIRSILCAHTFFLLFLSIRLPIYDFGNSILNKLSISK